MAWTPDGLTLACADGDRKGGVHVLDLGDSRDRLRLAEADRAASLAVSRDGRTLAAGLRDGRVALYDLATVRPLGRWRAARARRWPACPMAGRWPRRAGTARSSCGRCKRLRASPIDEVDSPQRSQRTQS
ncbi:MAG: WD40 repeat domain-containing protein [Gemmataceae bacterium]|nr:WD40 repeat domain-containing protein [Gemmataceae bacterium]